MRFNASSKLLLVYELMVYSWFLVSLEFYHLNLSVLELEKNLKETLNKSLIILSSFFTLPLFCQFWVSEMQNLLSGTSTALRLCLQSSLLRL